MLVLSRKKSESITIGLKNLVPLIESDPAALREILIQPIGICQVDIRGDKGRLGIDAHHEITVHRNEVQVRVDAEQQDERTSGI